MNDCFRLTTDGHPIIKPRAGVTPQETFLNLTDPLGRYVSLVIDINPKKQNQFIAVTGHPVVAPDEGLERVSCGDVLVMNENYYDEICAQYDSGRFRFHVL